jgi:hypothetical protein
LCVINVRGARLWIFKELCVFAAEHPTGGVEKFAASFTGIGHFFWCLYENRCQVYISETSLSSTLNGFFCPYGPWRAVAGSKQSKFYHIR